MVLLGLALSNARAEAGPSPTFKVVKGASCTLTKALVGTDKKGKKTIAVKVPAGESLSILGEARKGAVAVKWKANTFSAVARQLETFCALAQPASAKNAPENTEKLPPPTEPAIPAEPAKVEVAKDEAPQEPAKIPGAVPPPPAKAGNGTRLALGALIVPLNTEKAIADGVRELILDVVQDAPNLSLVPTRGAPTDGKELANCFAQNECLRDIGQKSGATYVLAAMLKAETRRGVIVFRLIDVASGQESKKNERVITRMKNLGDEVSAGTKAVLRDLLPEDAGFLLLKLNEDGVQVSIDGADAGLTPLSPKKLRSGEHTLLLKKPHFETKTETVTIDGMMRATNVEIFFEPEALYKKRYVETNTTLRALAWTGVAFAATGAAAGFGLRMGANWLYDDIQRHKAILDAQKAPAADYATLRKRNDTLPVLDGLSWGAAAVGTAGAITAIICFAMSSDPHRYDKPKRKKNAADKVGLEIDWQLRLSPYSVGVAGAF